VNYNDYILNVITTSLTEINWRFILLCTMHPHIQHTVASSHPHPHTCYPHTLTSSHPHIQHTITPHTLTLTPHIPTPLHPHTLTSNTPSHPTPSSSTLLFSI